MSHPKGSKIVSDEQQNPLQHLRVLDMTVMLPGPYLTRILAGQGAEVIKVEAMPFGDPIRQLRKTAMMDLLNEGKQSVAINLKSEEGQDLVRQMASEADVFVENFRDGVMDRLGLGYPILSRDNPELLYVSMRGFSGKHSQHAGHDLNFVSTSGCGEWFLENGPNYSTHWGDLIGGVFVPAIRVLGHLSNPDRRGMQVITYMDEGFRSLFLHRAYDAARAMKLPEVERPTFGSHQTFNGNQPHSRYYRCQDGDWISMNTVQPKHWYKFCEVIDRKQWLGRAEDPALIAEVEELFESQSAGHWEALGVQHDMCIFRVVPWEQHLDAAHQTRILEDPLGWSGFGPAGKATPAPELGKDTFSVLKEMGLSEKEISGHIEKGVLLQAPKT